MYNHNRGIKENFLGEWDGEKRGATMCLIWRIIFMDILRMNNISNIAIRYLNCEECELICSYGYLVVPKFFSWVFLGARFFACSYFYLRKRVLFLVSAH